MVDDHFKSLSDEYVSKVIVNGSTPKMSEFNAAKTIRQKVLALYHIYFYG